MVYIIIKDKIMLSHIPKSGCQSIRKFAIDCNENIKNTGLDDEDFYHKKIWGGFKWFSSDVDALFNQGYELISIVRNPYSRLVSGYTNKVLSLIYNYEPINKIIKHYNSDNLNRVTFEQFVDYIMEQDSSKLDQHWVPQYLHIGEKYINKTKIFKLENTEINDYLKNKTGFTYRQYKSSDLKKPTDYDGYFGDKNLKDLRPLLEKSEMPNWENFYTEELKEKVYNYYKKDFELLGYEK